MNLEKTKLKIFIVNEFYDDEYIKNQLYISYHYIYYLSSIYK